MTDCSLSLEPLVAEPRCSDFVGHCPSVADWLVGVPAESVAVDFADQDLFASLFVGVVGRCSVVMPWRLKKMRIVQLNFVGRWLPANPSSMTMRTCFVPC